MAARRPLAEPPPMETPCHTDRTGSPATREVAIVTGGSSGIGRATVLALARAGLDVGFTYRSRRTDAEAVAAEARSHGVRAATYALDLRDAGRGAVAVDALADELGRVDVLVNNAAANPRAAFLRQSLEAWRATLEIDLTGPLACAQAAALRMVAQGGGGRIVNVTSRPIRSTLQPRATSVKIARSRSVRIGSPSWARRRISLATVVCTSRQKAVRPAAIVVTASHSSCAPLVFENQPQAPAAIAS
jgi:hypothetical protein